MMDFVRMGNSGLKITPITFGTALTIGTESSDIEFANRMIDTAWNLGIRAFDTSNNYGEGMAEKLTGLSLSRYPRQEYVLSTKGSWPIGKSIYNKGLSRKHIMWAFDESIKRLQCDYVDVYYAHRYDAETPMREIVTTFNSLINDGKIRYWATSEWPVEALEECHRVCNECNLEKPIVEQFIYSYAIRKAEDNGVKSFCNKNGVGTLGFSPLAQGLLTGKYKNGVPKDSRIAKSNLIGYNKTINIYNQNKETIDGFIRACEEFNVNMASAAIQWCIRNKIYPVIGASKPRQLEENIISLQDVIPEEFWYLLESGVRE